MHLRNGEISGGIKAKTTTSKLKTNIYRIQLGWEMLQSQFTGTDWYLPVFAQQSNGVYTFRLGVDHQKGICVLFEMSEGNIQNSMQMSGLKYVGCMNPCLQNH